MDVDVITGLQDEAPASTPATVPAEVAEAPSPQDAGGSATTEAQPAEHDLTGQPAPSAPAATDPASPPGESPTDRTPFAFRVDRTEVNVPGAFIDAEGFVRIPKDQWDRTIQPRVADRGQIQRELQQREQQIAHWRAQADPARNPDVQHARLLVQQMEAALFGEGLTDEQVLDQIDRIRGSLPLLRERADRLALEERLTERDNTASQYQAVEAWNASVPVLGQTLQEYVGTALQHPEIAAAGLDVNELLETLWRDGTPGELAEIFEDVTEANQHLPIFDTPGGTIVIRSDRVDRVIRTAARAAQRVQTQAGKELEAERNRSALTAKAAEAAKANAQALAGRTAAPPVVGGTGNQPGVGQEKAWTRLRREAEEQQAAGNYAKAQDLRQQATESWERHMAG